MNNNNNIEKSLFLNLLRKFIGISAVTLGFLYVCGLFITNVHLRRFGIYDFASFRFQYILVGFTFVLILLAPILVFILISTIIGKKIPIVSKILEVFIVLICVGATLIYLTISLLYGDFKLSWILAETGQIIKIANFYWLLFAWLFYVTGKSLIYDLKRLKREEISNLKELWIPVIFFFGMFIISISFYAQKIYPKTHPAFAGGKPISAEILISTEGSFVINSLGLTLENNQILRDISIIHETPSMLYIIPQEKEGEEVKSFALPKKIVNGIKFLSKRSEN